MQDFSFKMHQTLLEELIVLPRHHNWFWGRRRENGLKGKERGARKRKGEGKGKEEGQKC